MGGEGAELSDMSLEFSLQPFSAQTVTAESRHVNLTSSSVSHLLMLSVDWFSFSSSPCWREKASWDRSEMSVAMPATSGKCSSSNPTLKWSSYVCFSSHVSYTLMTHRCFTLLFSLWDYFLSWVENEKPVQLAQSYIQFVSWFFWSTFLPRETLHFEMHIKVSFIVTFRMIKQLIMCLKK